MFFVCLLFFVNSSSLFVPSLNSKSKQSKRKHQNHLEETAWTSISVGEVLIHFHSLSISDWKEPSFFRDGERELKVFVLTSSSQYLLCLTSLYMDDFKNSIWTQTHISKCLFTDGLLSQTQWTKHQNHHAYFYLFSFSKQDLCLLRGLWQWNWLSPLYFCLPLLNTPHSHPTSFNLSPHPFPSSSGTHLKSLDLWHTVSHLRLGVVFTWSLLSTSTRLIQEYTAHNIQGYFHNKQISFKIFIYVIGLGKQFRKTSKWCQVNIKFPFKINLNIKIIQFEEKSFSMRMFLKKTEVVYDSVKFVELGITKQTQTPQNDNGILHILLLFATPFPHSCHWHIPSMYSFLYKKDTKPTC